MAAFVQDNPNYAVIKVNIHKWGTPVTTQFGINSIPAFRVYDASKNLTAKGDEAWNIVGRLIQ